MRIGNGYGGGMSGWGLVWVWLSMGRVMQGG